jgi:signal transduction histidine kinase
LAAFIRPFSLIAAVGHYLHHQETTQKLNANVASQMLLEVQPFTDSGTVNEEALGKIMHSMMAVNPGIEVYLVNPEGKILSYVVLDKKVKLSQIDLQPVFNFLETRGDEMVLGDDPRQPGNKTIFSATPVKAGQNLLGYVYLVLASEQYETIANSLVGSYGLKLGTIAFALTLGFAFLLGILLISMLTKNLRVVLRVVHAFENGNIKERIPVQKMHGELALLGRTFNTMADTLEQNINSLTQVDQLRRELIANVSHDLRSPLTVIQGYIETMQMKHQTMTDAERQHYIAIIASTGKRLSKLVTDLFDLSKLESGQVSINPEPFALQDLLNHATTEFEGLAQKKNIRIQTNYADNLPLAFADVALIQRVIQNLVDNAIKYTPDNGTIDIKLQPKLKQLEVQISNSGDGISEADQVHIFNRYFKTNRQAKGGHGSGLGLAIVKKIIDVHQTNIWVSSAQGASTTFRFVLPAA